MLRVLYEAQYYHYMGKGMAICLVQPYILIISYSYLLILSLWMPVLLGSLLRRPFE